MGLNALTVNRGGSLSYMGKVTGALCHVSLVLGHYVTWLVRRVMGQSHNERLANFVVLMTVATFAGWTLITDRQSDMAWQRRCSIGAPGSGAATTA